MATAPWAPKGVEFRAGPDVGGHGWCMLCGQDAPMGVIMDSLGKATLGPGDIAFICFSCARRIGATCGGVN